jgi:hypothetical protein
MDLAASLKQNLDALPAAHEDRTVAVAFHNLQTGAEYFARADESFHPASTFRVAVMPEIFPSGAYRPALPGRQNPGYQFIQEHRRWKRLRDALRG